MRDRGVRIGRPVLDKPFTPAALFSAVEAVLPQGRAGARRLDNRRRLIRWAMSVIAVQRAEMLASDQFKEEVALLRLFEQHDNLHP